MLDVSSAFNQREGADISVILGMGEIAVEVENTDVFVCVVPGGSLNDLVGGDKVRVG